MSVSGHVPSGETPISSLIREINEEIGLNVKENELELLGKFWRHELHNNNTFIENELDYIFLIERDLDETKLTLQKDEVENIKWLSTTNFQNLLKNNKAVKRSKVWNTLFNYLENKS